ncbi:unnamed protein product [Arabidopsis thaliana]|uniref:(thale cress) hypothetical protein n=1 Tax=Arabidopsis thaliana TaxID=3702 RepID=A0A7G2EUM5_ARATH|nr:unnamed protein product [Arabidopsis thaliana]
MRGLLLLILCFYLFGGLGFKSTFCSVRVVEEIGARRLLLEAVVVVFWAVSPLSTSIVSVEKIVSCVGVAATVFLLQSDFSVQFLYAFEWWSPVLDGNAGE